MTNKRWDGVLGSLILLATLAFLIFAGTGQVGAEERLGQPQAAAGDLATIHLGSASVVAFYSLDAAQEAAGSDEMEQDPWEPFNERMFNFNRNVVDRYLLKPVATAWDWILPDPIQRGIRNAMDNLSFVRRLVNNILQGKMNGTAREVARFGINTFAGLGGFFDVAKESFGLEQSDEDTGQTFGVYGMKQGPYLVLPFLPPMTVRDGVGMAIDSAMNPLNYFIPFYASAAIYMTNVVNDRSLNLDKYERVEESVIDLYSAVRNGYLQRREAAIRE
jgi:phospholipid-binding lipoprotein MlaA